MNMPQIPEQYLFLINQLFDMEKKVSRLTEKNSLNRNLDRMKNKFQDMGFEVADPLGEAYNETRTDCEANIAGSSSENLVISDVIKPIIRLRNGGASMIVQKAVVIAEAR